MADAALVVIERADGAVLGVSRPGLADDVGLPGGSLEPGETAEEAAIREVREETSLEVTVRPLFSEPYHGHLVHVFVATSWVGTPRSSPEGEVQWTSWAVVSRGRYADFNARIPPRLTR